jgi:hypothetical protein
VTTTIGFIGGDRLGLPIAQSLLDNGYRLVCTAGGDSRDILGAGASIPGDGTARAVSGAADILITRFPAAPLLEEAAVGPDGILASEHLPPLLEMSTLSLRSKRAVRRRFIERKSQIVDAPVSGTSEMLRSRRAALYASGDRDLFCAVEDVFRAVSPATTYVGSFGDGTKVNFVAQFLCAVETIGAIGSAGSPRLSPSQRTQLAVTCPFTTSAHSLARAVAIATEEFDSNTREGTLRDTIGDIIDYGREIPAPEDLISVLDAGYRNLADGDVRLRRFDTFGPRYGRAKTMA